MFSKTVITIICLAVFFSAAYAQNDTVRIFQYNLLNYGSSNNTTSYKDPRLTTIVQYADADIIGVNEIANSASHSQNILDNVLGAGWQKGTFVNTGNEIQTNMLFWKTDKFALKFQKSISYKLRDIIAFNLYYKDPLLEQTKDTIFLTVIVAHLKAGNSSQDKMERAGETQTVVNYLNSLGASGNYIFMGDFNLYTSDETAYSNLINNPNTDGRLYDPINRPGNWSGNSAFADIHTQSTRTSSLPDGGASGGLDDRFDHLMVSGSLLHNTNKCMYLPGSYTALGQDGKHLNKSITSSPANASVPANVVQALYEMSDHLPIYADFVLQPSIFPNNITKGKLLANDIHVVNPFNDKLIFTGKNSGTGNLLISVISTDGRTLMYKKPLTGNTIDVPSNWVPGMYVLHIYDEAGNVAIRKLIKE